MPEQRGVSEPKDWTLGVGKNLLPSKDMDVHRAHGVLGGLDLWSPVLCEDTLNGIFVKELARFIPRTH